MWINVGARHGISDIKTKTELKKLLKEQPEKVTLYETTMGKERNEHKGTELQEGFKYQVTGPNPYRDRKWCATVELKDGKVKVV